MDRNIDKTAIARSRNKITEVCDAIDLLDIPRHLSRTLRDLVLRRGLDFKIDRRQMADLLKYSVSQVIRNTQALEKLGLLFIKTRYRTPRPGQEFLGNDWNRYVVNVNKIMKMADAIQKKRDRQYQKLNEQYWASQQLTEEEKAALEPVVTLAPVGDTPPRDRCETEESKRNPEEEYIPAEGNSVDQEEPITRTGLFDWVFNALRQGGKLLTELDTMAAVASLKDYCARSRTWSYLRAFEFVQTGLVFHQSNENRRLQIEIHGYERNRAYEAVHGQRTRVAEALADYLNSKVGKFEAWTMNNDLEACYAATRA